MRFTLNTTALQNALNLTIIKANISQFFRRSCLLQIIVKGNELRLITESVNICIESRLHGKSDSDDMVTMFVDNVLFQSLVNTINTNTIILEFSAGKVTIRDEGTTALHVPEMMNSGDLSLQTPFNVDITTEADNFVAIDFDRWRHIHDYQLSMLGVGMSYPIYRNLWISSDGDVLSGDYDKSIFTHSKYGDLTQTCLLPNTVANLIISLPEDSKIVEIPVDGGNKYQVVAKSDSMDYRAEFTPLFESDPNVGDYGSEFVLKLLQPTENCTEISYDEIMTVLNQAKICNNEDVYFTFIGDKLKVVTTNVQREFTINPISDKQIDMTFVLNDMIKVLSNYSENVHIGFSMRDEQSVGLLVWNDDIVTVIGKKA